MCLVDVETFRCVPCSMTLGLLGLLIRAVTVLNKKVQLCLHRQQEVGPLQDWTSSLVLFATFTGMISRCRGGVRFGGLRILTLLFAGDVVLLASSCRDPPALTGAVRSWDEDQNLPG